MLLYDPGNIFLQYAIQGCFYFGYSLNFFIVFYKALKQVGGELWK